MENGADEHRGKKDVERKQSLGGTNKGGQHERYGTYNTLMIYIKTEKEGHIF